MRNASSLLLLMLCFYAAVKGLEELVELQAVYLETSLYPSVQYRVAALDWTSEMMVCLWSTFVGQTFTSEYTVLSISPVCSLDLVGVIPLDADVHGAYLVSAAIIRRGASLINKETRLSQITELTLEVFNIKLRKLSLPTQLMRQNILATNLSQVPALSASADEAVGQVLLVPTQDPYKLRLSYRVQQCLEPCNSDHCTQQLHKLQLNERWPQVTCKCFASALYACEY